LKITHQQIARLDELNVPPIARGMTANLPIEVITHRRDRDAPALDVTAAIRTVKPPEPVAPPKVLKTLVPSGL